MQKNTVIKMCIYLDCAYKFQDFAQSEEKFAQSHNCETAKFRNSVWNCLDCLHLQWYE